MELEQKSIAALIEERDKLRSDYLVLTAQKEFSVRRALIDEIEYLRKARRRGMELQASGDALLIDEWEESK